MLHFQEPLHGQFRFDGYVGTFRETYFIGIGFHFFQQAGSIQVFFNLFAYIETVHSDIHSGSFADGSVVVEDINALQIVFFAQHVVVYVVSRSNFQTAGTEFDVYIAVLNNRNNTSYQRNDYFLAFQPLVLRVGRIDTHGGITHDGFRTGSGYNCIAAALCIAVNDFTFSSGFSAHIVVGNIVAQVIQLAVFFLINYFFVRKGSQCLGIPVHHAHAAVDEAFVVQVYKYLDDALAAFFIHGESGAVPVA